MVGGHGRRADDDLGAVGLEHVALVLARPCPGTRRRTCSPCAGPPGQGRRRCCRRWARRWCRPGLSSPEASAASTMRRAMRSFTDPPGFMYSTFARTVQATPASLTTLLSLTRGVFPTRSAMCSAYFTRAILSDGGQPVCRAAVRARRRLTPGFGHRQSPAVVTVVGHPHRKGHTHGEGGTRTSDRRHRCLWRRWCRCGHRCAGRDRLRGPQGRGPDRPRASSACTSRGHRMTTASTAPGPANPSSSSCSVTPRPPAWAPTTATRPSGRSSPPASPRSPAAPSA